MENPTKMDDLVENAIIFGNTHIDGTPLFAVELLNAFPTKNRRASLFLFFEEKFRLLWWFQEVYPKLMELFGTKSRNN